MGIWRDTMYAWYKHKYLVDPPFLSTPEGIIIIILLSIITVLIMINILKKK
jgi:hypothetical protein